MLNWLKKLFYKTEEPQAEDERPRFRTKPCRTCGAPISYDPSWKHIPNYCSSCKQKYREENSIPQIMRRKCRQCGKSFTFPSTIQHYPNYCRECRARFKERNKK